MTSAAKLDPRLLWRGLSAAGCAWLIPGAGHFLLGAKRRALVFFVLVVLTIGLGLACDGNLAVVDVERAPVLTGLQVVGNLALGPVELLLRRTTFGAVVYRVPAQESSASAPTRRALEARSERFFRRFSAYGTAYLMAAGLMNLLLILDAWDIGIGRRS